MLTRVMAKLLVVLHVLVLSVLFAGLCYPIAIGRRLRPIFSTMGMFAVGQDQLEMPAIWRSYVELANGERLEYLPKLPKPFGRSFYSQFLWRAKRHQSNRAIEALMTLRADLLSQFPTAKKVQFYVQWHRPIQNRLVLSVDDLVVEREEVVYEFLLSQ